MASATGATANANYALTETPINIAIKDRAPGDDMGLVDTQIVDGKLRLGEITDAVHLATDFAANAVHDSIRSVTTESH